jgi:uncharacterized protein (TIGR03067 family)
MKKCLLGVLVIGLLIAADEKPKADDAKDKLKGTWTVVAMERDGKKAPEEEVKGKALTFAGDKVTFKRDDDTKTGTFKLDSAQKPPHLDLTPDDGEKLTIKMLYQLDGDTLKLYGDKSEKGDRPKSYEAAAMIITLKREKK